MTPHKHLRDSQWPQFQEDGLVSRLFPSLAGAILLLQDREHERLCHENGADTLVSSDSHIRLRASPGL